MTERMNVQIDFEDEAYDDEEDDNPNNLQTNADPQVQITNKGENAANGQPNQNSNVHADNQP